MSTHLTLGVEQEFQLVERHTGELCSRSKTIVEKARPYLGENIKLEAKQACVELATRVCSSIADVRSELTNQTRILRHVVADENLTLLRAGTHPEARWATQKTTQEAHYQILEEEYQDLERMLVIYGLHIHVGGMGKERLLPLLNQVRTWLPHLLALSANSPFWEGRYTGLQSYRSALWRLVPRSGIPEIITSWEELQQYIQDLLHTGCIHSSKELYWDIRPHPLFDTLEIRICDMPATLQDTIALTALYQALVAKLIWLNDHQQSVPLISREHIEENKWRAMRYGLNAEIIDFANDRRLGMRDALHQLLDFVDDVVDDLGSRAEMSYLRAFIDDPRGTGADQQIAIFQREKDVKQVTNFLLRQTLEQ